MSQLARMEEALDEELAGSSPTEGASGSKALMLASLSSVGGSRHGPFSAATKRPPTAALRAPGGWGLPQQQGGHGAAFASMSLGMGRASRVLLDVLSHAARHVTAKRPSVVAVPSSRIRRAAAASSDASVTQQ